MASVKLYLDKRRSKSNGSYPLKLTLSHKNKCRYIPLGYCFKETEWDDTAKLVRSNFPNSKRVNNSILKKLSEASILITENEDNVKSLSIDQLKEELENKLFGIVKQEAPKEQKLTFLFEFSEMLIERLKKANKFGNASTYQQALNSFKRFRKDRDILLYKVDYTFLVEFEADCLNRAIKINTISIYLRTLRAIMNKAISEGYLNSDYYPFKKFKIKSEATKKRAISKEEIKAVLEIELPINQRINDSRNYFNFMFQCRGMNFIDVAFLTKENIKSDRLVYRRRKTGKLYDIKLTEKAKEIIKYYSKRKFKKVDKHLFPILKRNLKDDPEQELIHFKDCRRYFNRDLKEIGKRCKIEASLTSYVSRHSWASIAKFAGIAPAVIGESLGHSNLKTTETYLANFDHDTLDNANEIIVG